MTIKIRDVTLELVTGDITDEKVDAIVNAANTELRGGSGVDGAIHQKGGPEILKACKMINGCPTGEARITTAGCLPARWVIHTVGPVWRGGSEGEPQLLASAYRESLGLAQEKGIASLAFPSLSTGAYGYPIEQASQIALAAVLKFMEHDGPPPATIRFVLFSQADLRVYSESLKDLRPS